MAHVTLFTVLNSLHFYVSTDRSKCSVSNVALFCTSLILCFPGMLLRYFLSDFKMVQFYFITIGITLVFTFNMRNIFIARYLYFRIFSASFLMTFFILNLNHLLTHMFLFIVKAVSVGLHLSVS